MHIAAALNRPLVVVYGSTSPKFTPPLSDCVSIEQLDVDCGPCFQRQCPLPETQGRMQCLQALQPERVILSIDRLMTTQPHENSV
jgi:heptosyltransferase-2